MRKIVNICIFVLLLFCLPSCGADKDRAINKSDDYISISEDGDLSLENEIESNEETIEWINPYVDRYRVI